ncbi:MAG: dTMP kinase, partial [Actinobacteria bacterium]|nr:dTMP kinase [Actinomycetota bacterium]
MSGRYIAFEGVEGCGKSTHVKRLAAHLDALVTREPGGTAIGSVLRG